MHFKNLSHLKSEKKYFVLFMLIQKLGNLGNYDVLKTQVSAKIDKKIGACKRLESII